MIDNELIKYAIQNGIIDISSIQNEIEMNKRNRYLEMHTYQIWKGNNGKWYTYLPTGDKGRKLIKRTSEKAIQDVVVKYYEDTDEEVLKEKEIKQMTLRTLYKEWIKYKSLKTISSSYIRKIEDDWKAFYEKDEISDIPIRKFNKIMLDEWAHSMIKTHEMTKTKYYNMSVIIRQSLDYALDCGYIDHNYFSDIKVEPKMFKGKKSDNKKEVVMTDEEPILKEYCMKKHVNNPKNTTSLAILLLFEVGCRVGELVALTRHDIQGNYVHICKQEVTDFEYSNSEYKFSGRSVAHYTKSECGDRMVYLSSEARRLISEILATNSRCGYSDEDYIILNRNGRTKAGTITKQLGIYCQDAGISHKCSHKIRKTYISKLIDGNVNIKTVMKQVGHVSAKTTYSNYCFDRNTDTETERRIEGALCSL